MEVPIKAKERIPMAVHPVQVKLAKLMEKGTWYEPNGKADTLTYNPKFWLNDLSKDEFLDYHIKPERRKDYVGYYASALGFALVGKFGSPHKAKQQLERCRGIDEKGTVARLLGIPERLMDAVDDLEDRGKMTVPKVVSILRSYKMF